MPQRLIIGAEKKLFAKHGMPDFRVYATSVLGWGATHDNLMLGDASNGIDGVHILTSMPYLIHIGKVTQNKCAGTDGFHCSSQPRQL